MNEMELLVYIMISIVTIPCFFLLFFWLVDKADMAEKSKPKRKQEKASKQFLKAEQNLEKMIERGMSAEKIVKMLQKKSVYTENFSEQLVNLLTGNQHALETVARVGYFTDIQQKALDLLPLPTQVAVLISQNYKHPGPEISPAIVSDTILMDKLVRGAVSSVIKKKACQLRGHCFSENNCYCTVCGVLQHNWDGCTCTRCKEVRSEGHVNLDNDVICSRCGWIYESVFVKCSNCDGTGQAWICDYSSDSGVGGGLSTGRYESCCVCYGSGSYVTHGKWSPRVKSD